MEFYGSAHPKGKNNNYETDINDPVHCPNERKRA